MPISLSAGNVETFTLGGATVATHDSEAISNSFTDYLGNTMTIVFAQGTPANNSFATDARAKTHTMTLNLNTGQWTVNGTLGTLTTTALSGLNTNQKNLKNALEQIFNNAVSDGTFNAWV